jgi:hypothetical protein
MTRSLTAAMHNARRYAGLQLLCRMGAVVRLCLAHGCPRRAIEDGAGVAIGRMVAPEAKRGRGGRQMDAAGKRALLCVPNECWEHASRLADGRCRACYYRVYMAQWRRMRGGMGCSPAEAMRLFAWLDWVIVAHAHAHGEAVIAEVVEVGRRAKMAGCDLSAWGPGGLA